MNSTDTHHTTGVDSGQGRAAEPQAVVDVERQCAVRLASGAKCPRGLTCTRHGMSAKRAVPGRSAPFDQLLAICQHDDQSRVSAFILVHSSKAPPSIPR